MSAGTDIMIKDALQVHDAECCSAEAPCSTRTRLTARLGNGIATPAGHDLSRPGYGKGGTRSTGAKQSRHSAEPTEKMVNFLTKLIAERDYLSLSEKHRTWVDLFRTGGKLTFSAARELIDTLLHTAYSGKVSSNGFQKDQAPKALAAEPLVPGIYRLDDKVITVQISRRSGNHYGLVLDTEAVKFVYAPGATKGLTAEHLMSLDEAKEFGRETGICCHCGAELTDPKSIAAGIGPICAGHFN